MTGPSYEMGLNSEQLAYDLRQRYAKLVGDHLEDIAIARKHRLFSDYFDALEDLYVITKHKFRAKKSKEKDGEEDEKEKKTFEDLRQDAVNLMNEYPEAWTGASKDPEEVGKILDSLRAMEMWLYDHIDKAKMFGAKRDTEGLI